MLYGTTGGNGLRGRCARKRSACGYYRAMSWGISRARYRSNLPSRRSTGDCETRRARRPKSSRSSVEPEQIPRYDSTRSSICLRRNRAPPSPSPSPTCVIVTKWQVILYLRVIKRSGARARGYPRPPREISEIRNRQIPLTVRGFRS